MPMLRVERDFSFVTVTDDTKHVNLTSGVLLCRRPDPVQTRLLCYVLLALLGGKKRNLSRTRSRSCPPQNQSPALSYRHRGVNGRRRGQTSSFAGLLETAGVARLLNIGLVDRNS